MKKLTLTATTALIAVLGVGMTAQAETVRTETVVETQEIENVNQINFSAFDLNKDGIYDKAEVGEKLFYVFDRDGNEVIDNMEWDDENMYTIIPMEKETFKFIDHDDDGTTDQSTYTYETFYQESGLIRFDNNKNGLSAAEFIGKNMIELDIDKSGMIEIDEWKQAYTESISPKNADQERYN